MKRAERLSPDVRRVLQEWSQHSEPPDPKRDHAQIALGLAVFDQEHSTPTPGLTPVLGDGWRWWPLVVVASLMVGSVLAWRSQAFERVQSETSSAEQADMLALQGSAGLVIDLVEARPVVVELSRQRSLRLEGRARVVLLGVDLAVLSLERGHVRARWQAGVGERALEVRSVGRRFTQTVGEVDWRAQEGAVHWTAISATVVAQPALAAPLWSGMALDRSLEPTERIFGDRSRNQELASLLAAPLSSTYFRELPEDEQLFAQALSALRAGTGDSAKLFATELIVNHPDSRWVGPAMVLRADTLRHRYRDEAVEQYQHYLSRYAEGHEVAELHPGNLRDHALSMLSALGQ